MGAARPRLSSGSEGLELTAQDKKVRRGLGSEPESEVLRKGRKEEREEGRAASEGEEEGSSRWLTRS